MTNNAAFVQRGNGPIHLLDTCEVNRRSGQLRWNTVCRRSLMHGDSIVSTMKKMPIGRKLCADCVNNQGIDDGDESP